MSALDIIIIVIAAAGAFFGWRKGLIAQIGKLVGLFAAIMACRMFAPALAEWLIEVNTTPHDSADTRLLWISVAYLIVFLCVYITVTLLCSGLRKAVHAIATPLVDRACGALFKVLEYMIIASILLNMWLIIFPDSSLRRDKLVAGRPWGVNTSILTLAPDILGSGAAAGIIDCIRDSGNNDENRQQGKDV